MNIRPYIFFISLLCVFIFALGCLNNNNIDGPSAVLKVTEIGHYNFPGNYTGGFEVIGDFAYFPNHSAGLRILDIS